MKTYTLIGLNHRLRIPIPAGGAIIIHRGSWMKYAEYTLWPEQPADAVVRTNERWREWCDSLQQSELERP